MSYIKKLSCYELTMQLSDKNLTETELLGMINLYSDALDKAINMLADKANTRKMTQKEKDSYNLISMAVGNLGYAVHIGTGLTADPSQPQHIDDLNAYLIDFAKGIANE